ncbi:hypothetical protein CDAR_100491 [Caerostris darwini]|uniref:Uncharacterized protein n=1 Tax=Caerostris darwini TaxID=1538125 RepID=A0AAV4X3E4_9ARAC|nr:hypothetical protein CDAR_100491 [Caerostris darwini]
MCVLLPSPIKSPQLTQWRGHAFDVGCGTEVFIGRLSSGNEGLWSLRNGCLYIVFVCDKFHVQGCPNNLEFL